jgi:transcription elongation factor Elf1
VSNENAAALAPVHQLVGQTYPKYPDCPICGNNRQVWINQLTGVMTCHRAGCHTEIRLPNEKDERRA